MAGYLRRCVALDFLGHWKINNVVADYRVAPNPCLYKQSQTKWIRLWADWPSAQPNAGDNPANSSVIASLDDQIRQARANGLKVILTAFRFPKWTNPTTPYSTADQANKDEEFRVPADLSVSSPFGQWMQFLINRYGRLSPVGAPVDFFEVCNEPNRQMWPQQDSAGAVQIGCSVCWMFQTAQAIANAASPPLVTLAGPGMLDQHATGDPRAVTPYPAFMNNLFYNLGAVNFYPGPYFAFTTHNYADILDGHTVASNTRAADIISRLRSLGWRGWPSADSNDPYILITEGGVVLKPGYGPTEQRVLLERNAGLMHQLPGVGMITQYLMYTSGSTSFDSGLVEVNGTKRPAFNMWSCLTSAGPTLTQPSGCAPGPTC